MLYSISKKLVSCREIKKIKKIWGKYSKKVRDSSSNSSSDDLVSDSSLASDGSWDKYIWPTGHKEMNKLYHIVTNNLKTTKYQLNEAINNDPTFDTNIFNLSSGTSNPLPVLTVSIWQGKKHRATTVSRITLLWVIGATNGIINRKHIKHYECKMRSNKVEYSIATVVYCKTDNVKVPFCIPEFFSARQFIISFV